MNPKYLLCDEPNSGLDPYTATVIDELLKEITYEYNITTVINTHDMNSFLDLFYYSMVTQTTVGYGDIVPVSKLARVGAICQMLLVYAGLGLTEGKILKAIGF